MSQELPDQRPLYRKFTVQRVDGTDAPGQKHAGCNYFVLDLDHDPHAKAALRAYAKSCRSDRPTLSRDLSAIVDGNALMKARTQLADPAGRIAPQAPAFGQDDALLKAFDVSVAGVHLLDGPRPNYELWDKAEWHTRGISQGLKIARVILEENLKALSAAPQAPAADPQLQAIAQHWAKLDVQRTYGNKGGEHTPPANAQQLARAYLGLEADLARLTAEGDELQKNFDEQVAWTLHWQREHEKLLQAIQTSIPALTSTRSPAADPQDVTLAHDVLSGRWTELGDCYEPVERIEQLAKAYVGLEAEHARLHAKLTALSAAIREVNAEIERWISAVVTGRKLVVGLKDLRELQVKLTALLAQETT